MKSYRDRVLYGFLTFCLVLVSFPDEVSAGRMLTGYETPYEATYGSTGKVPGKVPDKVPLYRSSNSKRQGDAVGFTADHLVHDDSGQIITATGHVELSQAGRTLRADKVVYNLLTDTVHAVGNVVLHEVNGDVHFADEVRLSDEMTNGFVEGLQSYLEGGGRFTAKRGERIGGSIIEMYDATYTPCDCEKDKDGDPAWAIRAEKLVYDEEKHEISYKNARFELFGTPVAWTPYLVHPDGKVKRKSGFMAPSFGYDSELGFVVTPRYYWDIAPDRDATIGTMFMNREYPVVLGEYRQHFGDAYLTLNSSLSYSSRTDSEAGEDVAKAEELRGHLFVVGLWDIDEKLRAGVGLQLTADDQYLRQFDIISDSLLENEIYIERFDGRDYAIVRGIAFQDTRINVETRIDQPDILPEIEASFYGEPNALLGGRWSFDAYGLGLSRHEGQDVARLIAQGGWERRYVSGLGVVSTVAASARGDLYRVHDRDVATAGSGRSIEGSEVRFFPQIHLVSTYPLIKPYNDEMQVIIEPVAALTVAPGVDTGTSDIPNEDSQDVQIDASNLFEASRFPGLDRIEDRSRVTYGIRTGFYYQDGSYANIFVGQSYRFDEEDNPFAADSGLSDQKSDVVGQISAEYKNRMGFDYRFQLGHRHLTSERHELGGYGRWDRLSLNSRYLFAKSLEESTIDDSREQFSVGGRYKVNKHWFLRSTGLYDLGEEPGLRKATVGFDYIGCCMSFSMTAKRNLTSVATGDSSTDIFFRVGLKNIGEFQSSGGLGTGSFSGE